VVLALPKRGLKKRSISHLIVLHRLCLTPDGARAAGAAAFSSIGTCKHLEKKKGDLKVALCTHVFCLVRRVVLQARVVVPEMVPVMMVFVMKGSGGRVHRGKSRVGGCDPAREGRY
jgi:hypothetical protein